MTNYIEIPFFVTDSIRYWFSSRKCHRKSRHIKAVKRRFIKKYGKDAETFFDKVCTN